MEIKIEIRIFPSGMYERILVDGEWTPYAKCSLAVIVDSIKAAQDRVHQTGGDCETEGYYEKE